MANAVRKGEELDEMLIKKYLCDEGLITHLESNLEVSQFSNGYSNLTYLLSIENKAYVLRRPPAGAIKRGHDMGREYKVLSHLSKVLSKAPKTFAFEETGQLIGAPFYLMEKVEGTPITFKEAKESRITESDFKIISNSWLDTFKELHEVDYTSAGLEDLGKPDGYVERQVTNWSKQYYKAATREIKEADFVTQWMQDNQPESYDHCLIHNDFKYDNVVFDESDWSKVNAILDWEMCTLGDPLMDLGTSIGYWTMASDGPAITQGIPSPTMLPGNPTRTEVVHNYSIKTGRNINNLIFYYVYGLFKIAVIAQQIYYRYDKGLTSNKKFAKLDEACQFLCIMAKQAIVKKRIENLF